MAQMDAGPLADASLQGGMKRTAIAGAFGEQDPLRSTSSTIFVNLRGNYGTGALDVQHDDSTERPSAGLNPKRAGTLDPRPTHSYTVRDWPVKQTRPSQQGHVRLVQSRQSARCTADV